MALVVKTIVSPLLRYYWKSTRLDVLRALRVQLAPDHHAIISITDADRSHYLC